jgi:4-hydroxy-tetrahydrodipicolinate synthase
VFSLVRENDVRSALALWNEFAGDIPLLFQEPNPAPVKYCLSRMGLIRSAEVRLPLTGISGGLKSKLDGAFNPGACKQQDR